MNVFTEPLPSKNGGIHFTKPFPSDERGIHIETRRLMREI
jgi:hypothetical protein